jgi:hypothetical protein
MLKLRLGVRNWLWAGTIRPIWDGRVSVRKRLLSVGISPIRLVDQLLDQGLRPIAGGEPVACALDQPQADGAVECEGLSLVISG